MIITAARNTPVSSGVTESVDYKIDTANLGHIASILRKAYSDPIRAVIREYGTNACEAHMLNGKEKKPFEVTLPTTMAPTFKLRDFGPGLGPDSFRDLFCSYGGSSKRTSNQFTGCLGIGCKSYGAYTDAATVIDIHGGVKRIWNSFIDETEVGKASLLSETKAHDLSGVEIQIAVRPQDVERFRATAIKVYKVFDVQPVITNATPEEKKELANLDFKSGSVTGPNWSFNGSGTSWLQMGLVLYPLKSDFSGPKPVKQLIDAGVYVRVNLGDVQIAPSREDLQYSPKTVNAIINHLKPVYEKLGDSLIEAVKASPDYLQAHFKLTEFRRGDYGSSDFRNTVIEKVRKDLVWNGIPLRTDAVLPLADDEKDSKGDIVKHSEEVLKDHGISLIRVSKRGWGKTKFNVVRDDPRIHISKDIELFLNSGKVPGTGEARAREWFNRTSDSGDKTVYVLTCKNGGKAWLESTLPWFSSVNFRSAEELPKPAPKVKTVDADGNEVEYTKDKKHSKGNLFRLGKISFNPGGNYNNKLSDHWVIAPPSENEQIVYVVLNKFEWAWDKEGAASSQYSDLYLIRKYLQEIAGVEHLYGIKESETDKKIRDGWLSLKEAIRTYVPKFLSENPDKAQQVADRRAARQFFRNTFSTSKMKETGSFFDADEFEMWTTKRRDGKSLLDQIDQSSPFRIYLEHIQRMVVLVEKGCFDSEKLPEYLRAPVSYWKTDQDKDSTEYKKLLALLPKPSFDLRKATLGLLERYPIFGKFETHSQQFASDAFKNPTTASVEYIKLVDDARGVS